MEASLNLFSRLIISTHKSGDSPPTGNAPPRIGLLRVVLFDARNRLIQCSPSREPPQADLAQYYSITVAQNFEQPSSGSSLLALADCCPDSQNG